jgi:hypothetical protein
MAAAGRQYVLECLTRIRLFDLRNLFRCARRNDMAAGFAAFRSEIDQVVAVLITSRLCSMTTSV